MTILVVGLDNSSDTGLSGADEDAAALLTAQHLVLLGSGKPVDVHLVELQVASLTTSLAQNRRPDAPTGRSDLRIEVHQVLADTGDDVTPRIAELLNLGVHLRKSLVAQRLQDLNPLGQLRAGNLQPGDIRGKTLGPLHHLKLDVLEIRLTVRERLDLMMQGLHVLGGPLTGLHARLVAGAAFAHKLNVGLGLGNLALDVIEGSPGADQVVVQCRGLGIESAQLDKLWQSRLVVLDLVQTRVERLKVQQAPLTARVGFQDVPPVMSLALAPITKSHGSVRSVQM